MTGKLPYLVCQNWIGERLFVDLDPDVGIPLWIHRLCFKPPVTVYQVDVAARCMALEARDLFGHCDVRIMPGSRREGRSKWARKWFPPAALPRDGTADGLYWYRIWKKGYPRRQAGTLIDVK